MVQQKLKLRQGESEIMRRAVHTFLAKNKQMTGMAVGAIAMLAMAAPALSQETSGTDEVFQLTTVID